MDLYLDFFDDPADFLAVAGEVLAADPVLTTVVSTVTHRLVGTPAPDGIARWWVVALDGDRIIGVAMRTATGPPFPPYVLPMPEGAAVALARALIERGETLTNVNGALPSAQHVAEEAARMTGGTARPVEHVRLHELTELVPPAPVAGRLRMASPDDPADVAIALAWFAAFDQAAAEQADRPAHAAVEPQTAESMRTRMTDGRVWFWEDATGSVVHLTAASAPAFGVVRIGPVFTPREQRGHGWASAAVAEVSRMALADGSRVCLFTDQANPTSNKIYAALGYRPVTDMANFEVVRVGS